GKAHAHVKWIETHFDLGTLYCCISHGFTPVIQIVDLHSNTWPNQCDPFPRRWKRCHTEGFIIGYPLVRALSITFNREIVGFTWRHSKGGVTYRFILLICPLLYAFCKRRQRPHRMATWISGAGHLS